MATNEIATSAPEKGTGRVFTAYGLYNGQLYGPYTADAVAARNGTYCDILMFPRQGESWSDYLSRMESHVWDN
jgi:hypothetical protein